MRVSCKWSLGSKEAQFAWGQSLVHFPNPKAEERYWFWFIARALLHSEDKTLPRLLGDLGLHPGFFLIMLWWTSGDCGSMVVQKALHFPWMGLKFEHSQCIHFEQKDSRSPTDIQLIPRLFLSSPTPILMSSLTFMCPWTTYKALPHRIKAPRFFLMDLGLFQGGIRAALQTKAKPLIGQ